MSDLQQADILLVEDSDSDAELTLRAMLKVGLGARVLRVKDGEEALEYLYHRGRYAALTYGGPKLVVLDVRMPRIDGIDLLRELKTNPATDTIPVVMLTSSAEERDVVESYHLGVNSYVVKPVEFEKFMEAVSDMASYWMRINLAPTPQ